MIVVLITALGVGGATVFGAVIGFLFKQIPRKFNDIVLSLGAGIMLSATIFGLIIPAVENVEIGNILLSVLGIFSGAAFLSLMDGVMPHLQGFIGINENTNMPKERINKMLLFVFAIGVHNLPEGIAAGVGFGTGDIANALIIAGGIALQNIPEGMVIIAPMLSAGVSPKRTILIAFSTGLVEVVGTFIGFFAVGISNALLPFALSFAGGTMIYVICDEMIPETHSGNYGIQATYSFILGFCIMLVMSLVLS